MNRTSVAALLLLSSLCSSAIAETYSFSVVPQQAAAKLARLWAPLLKEVSANSATTLRFSTAPNIPTFEERLRAGEYDFAYMNPYHFTVFNESPGYRAVARAKDKKIKGIVVVRKESTISELAELGDATLAFPAPAAFAASLLPRSNLKSLGTNITPRYVSSHDSVYRAVAKGLFPAGGGVVRTFRNVSPEIRDQLRILWTTDGYTPHAIAVHPRVPVEVVSAVADALLRLDTNKQGEEVLGALKLKGFVTALDSDWDDVRALKIDQLDVRLASK